MITISRELENAFGLSPLYSKEGQGFNATVLAMFVLPAPVPVGWLPRLNDSQTAIGSSATATSTNGNGGISPSELAELDLHGYVVETLRIQPDKLKVIDCYNAFQKVAG